MAEGDTALNALVGAVASIVLAFIPFSTVVGGAIAGYLQGGETGDGVRVGALSGAITAIPAVLLLFVGTAFIPFVPDLVAGVGFLFLLVIVALALGYTVVTSALGGALGIYLKGEL